MAKTYTIEYSLGGIKTRDVIKINSFDDFIKYIMEARAVREKLVKEKLTINIIDIQKKKYGEGKCEK